MSILAALLDALNLTLDGHLEKGETVFLQCIIMKTIDNLAIRVPVRCPVLANPLTDVPAVSGPWWQPAAN